MGLGISQIFGLANQPRFETFRDVYDGTTQFDGEPHAILFFHLRDNLLIQTQHFIFAQLIHNLSSLDSIPLA
jgi:hypothetical protein